MARFARAVVVAAASILLLASCTAPSPKETANGSPSPADATGGGDAFTPVLASPLSTPRAVPTSDGAVHVAYELFLSNVTGQTATVEQIEVIDESGDALLTLDGDAVIPWLHLAGATSPGRVIGPGQNALVWLDVVVASMDELPTTLTHDIAFAFEPGAPPVITDRMTERVATTPVDPAPPIVIGPPLEGAGWLNGNSCCAVTPHRAAVNAINGTYHAPERFAIDYVQLDDAGSFVTGPIDELESYPYFGANIVAVGDGPIVSMRFDLPEQKPGANPVGLTLDEYGGNHIVQDLGDGVYAFYAHLQPDNPAGVEVGQNVKKGDVIGLLGNTGNTDSPHLHFHLMDSPSPLGSNGVPFVFDAYDLAGTVAPDDLDARLATGGPFEIDARDGGPQRDLYPLWLTVTDYPVG